MRLTKDGGLYKGTAAASQAGFQAVIDRALTQAGKHLDAIRAGEAAVAPSEFRGQMPCAWCDLAPACFFDPRLDANCVRRFPKMRTSEALERIILEKPSPLGEGGTGKAGDG